MAFTVITTAFDNFSGGSGQTFNVSTSTAAQVGDVIVLCVSWRSNGINLGTPAWNGQNLAQIGTKITQSQNWMSVFYVQATAATTANVTAAFDNNAYANSCVMVLRPLVNTTVTASSFASQYYDSGTFANPSINIASVPVAAEVVDFLAGLAWDQSFGDTSLTTWAATLPGLSQGSTQNTNWAGVNRLYAQITAGGGSVTSVWTPSLLQPQWSHLAFYLSYSASASLDTLSAGAVVGGTGYSGTTTTMAAVTSLTNATITGTSSNAFTYNMNAFQNGVAYLAMGTPTFTASDGTLTATKASPLATMASYTAVLMSTMDTGNWSLGKDPAIVSGVTVHLPTAAGTLNNDGTLTGYTFGTYTAWMRDLSGIMYTFQVTISNSGINASNTLDLAMGKADLYKNSSHSSMSIN